MYVNVDSLLHIFIFIIVRKTRFPKTHTRDYNTLSLSPLCLFKQVNDLCILSAARDRRADFINSGQISLSSNDVYYTLKSQRNHTAHPHAVKSKGSAKNITCFSSQHSFPLFLDFPPLAVCLFRKLIYIRVRKKRNYV